MRIQSRLILAILISLAACSGGQEEPTRRSRMTQRERDSVLAESGLPGASVVGRALTAADVEARRSSMVDSAGQ